MRSTEGGATKQPERTDRRSRRQRSSPESGTRPERIHHALVRSSGDAILCLDFEGRILEWNPAAERLLGCSGDEISRRGSLDAFVPERSRGLAAAALARAAAGKPHGGIELPVDTPGAAGRVLLWSFARVEDGAEPHAIVAVGHDITGHKWAESVLAGQNRVLELIASGARTKRVLDQLARIIEQQSPGMLCSVLVYDPERRRLRHGAAPNLPEPYVKAVDGIRIGPEVGSCGTAAHRRERVIVERIETDPLWADFRDVALQHGLHACWSQPIFSSRGELLGTFAMYYGRPKGPSEFELELIEKAANLAGIALERRRTEAERARIQKQIQQAQKLESLGILAGGIAHDFNNLLLGILGNADLARAEAADRPELAEALEDIRDAGERAADLCRQMLAYSGKGSFTAEPVDVNQVVEDACRLVRASISPKARLDFRLAGGLPAIQGDATQLQQVVMNLLTNASDALRGGPGRIGLVTRSQQCDRDDLAETRVNPGLAPGDYVVVEVSDTGCGMPEEILERIFDPFFTTKVAGHGLGLAAVLGIIRGHRGALRVDSQPDEGTTFTVLLPAVGDAPRPRRPQRDDADDWRGEGLVLLVDDEPAVLRTARRMLEKAGFTVLAARDGREAVEVFEARAPEVVGALIDVTMPGMSGGETLSALRTIRGDLRAILTTGGADIDVARELAVGGRAAFLRKPYRFAQLRDLLRSQFASG